MRINIRSMNLVFVLMLAIAFVPTAFAQRRVDGEPRENAQRGYPGGVETEQRERAVDQERALHGGAGAESDRIDANERANGVDRGPHEIGTASELNDVRRQYIDRPDHDERRDQRACQYRDRSARPPNCDYYYDDDGQYYDVAGQVMVGWTPGDPMPTAANRDGSPGAAKLDPAAGDAETSTGQVYTEKFGPQGTNALRDALIAGRENFLEKKRVYDAASAAMARAEYEEYETGRPVDPTVIARQKAAKADAEAAHAALAPLVEQAKKQGLSPDLIDLYNQESELD
jgi:hypothetical protein